MTQYADNIRKIVGYKDVKDGTKTYDDKAKINGGRSIAYIDSTGSVQTTRGGKAGVDDDGNPVAGEPIPPTITPDEPSGTGEDPADAPSGGTAGGGGAVGGVAPGSQNPNVVDDFQGIKDIADLLSTGANMTPGDGYRLLGITGLNDCKGTELDVRFDGQFVAPEGWDYATPTTASGGPDPEFSGTYGWAGSGYRWRVAVGGYPTSWAGTNYHYFAHIGGAVALLSEALSDVGFWALAYPGDPPVWARPNIVYLTPPSGGYYARGYLVTDDLPYPGSFGFGVDKVPCTPGVDEGCLSVDPGYYNYIMESGDTYKAKLSRNQTTGFFDTHPYDLGAPPDLSNNDFNTLPFCYGSGNYGRIEPTRDGGFMLMKTTGSPSGSPTGIIRVFDKAGHLTGFADTTSYVYLRPS